MDHFALHRLFGLASTLELFGSAARRAHYTSALRYPVLKKSGNYTGDSRMAIRPFMRRMIEESLADQLAMLPKAQLVPFGPNAQRALDHLVAAGRIDEARILGGLLHPGGQQWNRYNVQLDLVSSSGTKPSASYAGHKSQAYKGLRKFASRDAIRRSHIQTISRPAPIAGPFAAAITGTSKV